MCLCCFSNTCLRKDKLLDCGLRFTNHNKMAVCLRKVDALIVLLSLLHAVKSEEKLISEVLKEPPSDCSRKAAPGDTISMHYRGTLKDSGKEFDSSYKRNQPFDVKLGAGNLIQGWEQGVPGMCVGEKRRLTVPPSLGYGDSGFGDLIPAGSTLVFEIELMDIKSDESEMGMSETDARSHEHPDTFESIDKDGNGEITSEEMGVYIRSFNDGHEEELENSPDDSIETIVGEIFQEDDKNKDGVITQDEFNHAGEDGPIPEDDMYPDDIDEDDYDPTREEL